MTDRPEEPGQEDLSAEIAFLASWAAGRAAGQVVDTLVEALGPDLLAGSRQLTSRPRANAREPWWAPAVWRRPLVPIMATTTLLSACWHRSGGATAGAVSPVPSPASTQAAAPGGTQAAAPGGGTAPVAASAPASGSSVASSRAGTRELARRDRTGRSGTARVLRYTPKPGESLWTLAHRFLGGGSRWRVLWAQNRDRVKNPLRVIAGRTLRIVVSPEQAARLARHRGKPAARPVRPRAKGVSRVRARGSAGTEFRSGTGPVASPPPAAASPAPVTIGSGTSGSRGAGLPLTVLVPIGVVAGSGKFNSGLELRYLAFPDADPGWVTLLQLNYADDPGQSLYLTAAAAPDLLGVMRAGPGRVHLAFPLIGVRGILDLPGGSSKDSAGLDIPTVGVCSEYRWGHFGVHGILAYDPVLQTAAGRQGPGAMPALANTSLGSYDLGFDWSPRGHGAIEFGLAGALWPRYTVPVSVTIGWDLGF